MIINEKHISNAVKELEWFVNMSNKRKNILNTSVSIENIVIEGIVNSADREFALEYAVNKLSNAIEPLDSEYSLYLMVNIILLNKQSKIEDYKKVWKKTSENFDISGFILGNEVKVEFHDRVYYSSLAKIQLKNLKKAFKIVCNNPNGNFIFISKNDKYLSSDETEKLFHKAFDSISKKLILVDFYDLALAISKTDEMVLRLLDYGDEIEVGLVYDPSQVCIMHLSS